MRRDSVPVRVSRLLDAVSEVIMSKSSSGGPSIPQPPNPEVPAISQAAALGGVASPNRLVSPEEGSRQAHDLGGGLGREREQKACEESTYNDDLQLVSRRVLNVLAIIDVATPMELRRSKRTRRRKLTIVPPLWFK